MNLSNYSVGLVLSRAGMNPAQEREVKHRLRTIMKLGGAKPDGLRLVVPIVLFHGGPKAAGFTEELLRPLEKWVMEGWLRVEILEEGHIDARAVMNTLRELDEVWCIPAERQSLTTNARPLHVFDMARHTMQASRFKKIPPWVEAPPERAAEQKKPKPLKGY